MMMVDEFVCNSCAVASITNVGECKGPEEALKLFCRTQLGVRNTYRKLYSTLTSYYVFCAGPEVPSSAKGGSHHSRNHWPKYGTELAEYITENGLGEIATVGPKINFKHHKKSTAQVWVWSPDQKALERWWDVKCAEEPKSTTPVIIEDDDAEDFEVDYDDEDGC